RGGRDRRGRAHPAVPLGDDPRHPSHPHLRDHHLDDRRPADLRRAAPVRPVRPGRVGLAVAHAHALPLQPRLGSLRLRQGVGGGVAAVPRDRDLRPHQPAALAPHLHRRDALMTIGPAPIPLLSPAQAARNRRRRMRRLTVAQRKPGILGYAFLGVVLLLSILPLYWSLLVASGDSTSARDPNLSWI